MAGGAFHKPRGHSKMELFCFLSHRSPCHLLVVLPDQYQLFTSSMDIEKLENLVPKHLLLICPQFKVPVRHKFVCTRNSPSLSALSSIRISLWHLPYSKLEG